jgi:hypothetical protein
MKYSIVKARVLTVSIVTLYVSAFMWSYFSFISPIWSYMGFSNAERNFLHTIQTAIICVLPSFWMPLKISRPSMVLYWILYLLTYIAMIVGVGFSSNFNLGQIYTFELLTLFGFFLNGIGYEFKLYDLSSKVKLNNTLFWVIFGVVALLLMGYVFYIFGGQMTLVNPFSEDLYDQRFKGRDLQEGTGAGYPVMWLSGNFFPFMLVYGFFRKKNIPIIVSTIGQVILYTTMADKSVLLNVIFMFLIYYLCKKELYFGYTFALIFTILAAFFTATQVMFEETFSASFWSLTNLLLIRTIGVSSLTANLYYDYFLDQPLTYYSHVNILRDFLPYKYPYGDEMIGIVIGTHYTDVPRFNANATFYITDGLVALGVWGIALISAICGLMFYFIDMICKKHDVIFCAMLLCSISMILMNGSIFMSILSGGLFFTLGFLYYFKPISQLTK